MGVKTINHARICPVCATISGSRRRDGMCAECAGEFITGIKIRTPEGAPTPTVTVSEIEVDPLWQVDELVDVLVRYGCRLTAIARAEYFEREHRKWIGVRIPEVKVRMGKGTSSDIRYHGSQFHRGEW